MNADREVSKPKQIPSNTVGCPERKGGVGKSTIAALLAAGLRRLGWQVGLLDADVTGASIPKLLGVRQPPLNDGLGGIIPAMSNGGIKVISVNLMLEHEDDAVIWRGPLVSKMIQQFWKYVTWGSIRSAGRDHAPGTSDAG